MAFTVDLNFPKKNKFRKLNFKSNNLIKQRNSFSQRERGRKKERQTAQTKVRKNGKER